MRDETASAATAGANEKIFNWGAVAMHAREAEAVNVKRAPVTVAVVDSGVEDTHPDLEGRVDTSRSVKCSVNGVATQDFYGWRDEFYHGTHVAGIIAANHNDIGIDGIAPEVTIVAIEATNDNRLIYPEYVTCAFMWAASHGVDVVNNSYSMDPWVYWSPTDPEQAAGLEAATRSIKYAQDKGLAVIAAAGNEGVDIDNPTIDNGSPTDVPTPTKNRAGGRRYPRSLHARRCRPGERGRSGVQREAGTVPGSRRVLQLRQHDRFRRPGRPDLLHGSPAVLPERLRRRRRHVHGDPARVGRRGPHQVGAPRADGRAGHRPDEEAGGGQLRTP